MTALEAKKIIAMCTDTVKKDDAVYINKQYVIDVLEMIDDDYKIQPGTEPITTPSWPPAWPQVWYKTSPDAPADPGPGFEKVPWWVWYKNWNEFTCDSTSTSSKPQDADIVTTSTDPHKFASAMTNPEDVKNVTITSDSSV